MGFPRQDYWAGCHLLLRGSSRSRDQFQVSCLADGFCTSEPPRKALKATSLSLFTFMHWRGKWQPAPVFLPGESQGWGSLVDCCMGSHRVGHDWSDLAAAAAWCNWQYSKSHPFGDMFEIYFIIIFFSFVKFISNYFIIFDVIWMGLFISSLDVLPFVYKNTLLMFICCFSILQLLWIWLGLAGF